MITLKWSAFPMPFWFSPRFDGFGEGEVISDNQVKVGNEIFTLESGVMPEIGTKLRVSPNRYNLSAETNEEYVEKKKLLEKEREERIRQKHEMTLKKEKELREKALKINNILNIPVRWTSGFKSVLSGLSENSMGNGMNKRTVIHILLLEDLKEGAFKRKSGSFLCTSKSGTDGKEWVDLDCPSYDHEGSYVTGITCKACLKRAERWLNKKEQRVEPEVIKK